MSDPIRSATSTMVRRAPALPRAAQATRAPVPVPVPPQDAFDGPRVSRSQFVDAFADKSISAATAADGVKVAKADLNGDGVIAGRAEWSALFTEIERPDHRFGRESADLGDAHVRAAVDAVARAPSGAAVAKPTYDDAEREFIARKLAHGAPEPSTARSARGVVDALGRALSPQALSVSVGGGVRAFYDPSLGFFKQKGDGPVVQMTAAERRAFVHELARHAPTSSAGLESPAYIALRQQALAHHPRATRV